MQFVGAAVAVVKGKAAGQECGEQQGGTERGGQAQLDGVTEGDGEFHGIYFKITYGNLADYIL